jgi:hypothetical protein
LPQYLPEVSENTLEVLHSGLMAASVLSADRIFDPVLKPSGVSFTELASTYKLQ